LIYKLSSLCSQLECWNNGILGSGKLRQWFIGKTLLTRKLINDRVPYKIIIPTFQYSICEAIRNSLKTIILISMSCKISETLHYQFWYFIDNLLCFKDKGIHPFFE